MTGVLELTDTLSDLDFPTPCDKSTGCDRPAVWVGWNPDCGCPKILRCDPCRSAMDRFLAEVAAAPRMEALCARCRRPAPDVRWVRL